VISKYGIKTTKDGLSFQNRQTFIDDDETFNGELYTILTNKAAKGKKGTIVAMIAELNQTVMLLSKNTLKLRNTVSDNT
jgi:hypothetical protein